MHPFLQRIQGDILLSNPLIFRIWFSWLQSQLQCNPASRQFPGIPVRRLLVRDDENCNPKHLERTKLSIVPVTVQTVSILF